MATAPEPGTVEQEIAAMRKICAALDQLDEPSRRRVMRYLTDRYPPYDFAPNTERPLSIAGDHYVNADPYPPNTVTPR